MNGESVGGCAFRGCDRPMAHRSNGIPYCKTHYEQARQGLTLKPIRPMLARGAYTACTFPGCDRPHSSQSYCASHYQQFTDGRPLTSLRGWKSQKEWGPTCRYGDCEETCHSRGLCIVHYGRGISQFARDAILTLQGGRCLCGTADPGGTGWHLDHAHECDRGHKSTNYCVDCVRGLLCIACNRHGIAWYENTYKLQPENSVIPLLEQWINRRIQFHGDVDAPEVAVSYVLSGTSGAFQLAAQSERP